MACAEHLFEHSEKPGGIDFLKEIVCLWRKLLIVNKDIKRTEDKTAETKEKMTGLTE